jgi:PilZ domain
MKPFKSLFQQFFSKDRRKSERQAISSLGAYYWTGGAPVSHGIRDISATGLYLVTEERWYPGTLIMMTLQKKDQAEGNPEGSISVQSKAVRWGTDGVGLEFILPEFTDRRRGQNLLNEGVDRKTLARFLEGFREDSGSAVVNLVVPPSSPYLHGLPFPVRS